MITFREINQEFLDWSALHKEPKTVSNYQNYSKQFLEYLGDKADVPAEEIKPHQVTKWIDSHHGEWGGSYKQGAAIAINRVYNWGIKQGHIKENPIKNMEKAQKERRENPMSWETYDKFLYAIHHSDSFRDVLIFAWTTGARPQEIRHIEARHFDAKNEVIALPPLESKGKKHKRTIYLPGGSLDMIKRLVAAYPEGKLFRNSKGAPWTKEAICARMDRLSKEIGVEHCLYDIRHSFCQRLLEAGWSSPEVMEAMGHRSTQMVDRVYSHMNKAQDHIKEKMRKIVY